MAVKIRLRRMGTKKTAFYRVVVADSRAARDGRFVESLGTYDPKQRPMVVKIDEEKALHWLQLGAQPTDTVRSLLSKAGIMKRLAEGKRAPKAEATAATTATA
jgi:small subunit ribosomal protein S16